MRLFRLLVKNLDRGGWVYIIYTSNQPIQWKAAAAPSVARVKERTSPCASRSTHIEEWLHTRSTSKYQVPLVCDMIFIFFKTVVKTDKLTNTQSLVWCQLYAVAYTEIRTNVGASSEGATAGRGGHTSNRGGKVKYRWNNRIKVPRQLRGGTYLPRSGTYQLHDIFCLM